MLQLMDFIYLSEYTLCFMDKVNLNTARFTIMSKTHTDIVLLLYFWILIIYPSITFKYKPILFKDFRSNRNWLNSISNSALSIDTTIKDSYNL